MMMMAVAVMALTAACTGKKTAENAAAQDTTSVVDSTTTPSLDLAVVAGTYEGTLPAADCPGIKTVLTLNTDSTARTATMRPAACLRCSTATC